MIDTQVTEAREEQNEMSGAEQADEVFFFCVFWSVDVSVSTSALYRSGVQLTVSHTASSIFMYVQKLRQLCTCQMIYSDYRLGARIPCYLVQTVGTVVEVGISNQIDLNLTEKILHM